MTPSFSTLLRLYCQNTELSATDPTLKKEKETTNTLWRTVHFEIRFLNSKSGEPQVNHYSSQAFYTLKGHPFGKQVTTNHTVVGSRKLNSIYQEINNLPLGKNSLHDIRLHFKDKGIWPILSSNSDFNLNPRSKDVRLPGINIDDLFIRITVHRTDTVSVIVACSYAPIAIDIPDIIRLSNSLTRVEERLARYIEESGILLGSKGSPVSIPNHMKWIVKMWHFGADELMEYAREAFEITYADAEGILTRIYSKQMKDGKLTRRLERQEYPNQELSTAIENKLNANCSGSHN